jgi:predicted site-specific integrase-resolvase
MAKLVGYARVSTNEQEVELQLDALRQAGCANEHIFIDKASGARSERPGLDACLRLLEPGDTLLVWRLDRLGRSMPHLVMLIEELQGFTRYFLPVYRPTRQDQLVSLLLMYTFCPAARQGPSTG